jgi:hypothetical protein
MLTTVIVDPPPLVHRLPGALPPTPGAPASRWLAEERWQGRQKTELSLCGQDTYNGIVKSVLVKSNRAVIAYILDAGHIREG